MSSLRSRADRHVYVFLFTKLFLMTKKEEDIYQYKMHLEVRKNNVFERVLCHQINFVCNCMTTTL